MQDQNVDCRRTCARPSRNLASTRGDGKCHIDAYEIHKCLYNMTITLRVKRSEQSYVYVLEKKFNKIKKNCPATESKRDVLIGRSLVGDKR